MSQFGFVQKIGGAKLTNREIAKIRMNKLVEAEKDGRLARAMYRTDIYRIVGIDDLSVQSKSSWLSRQIRRKIITETISGYDPKTRTPYFEYHIFPENLGRRRAKGYDATKAIKTEKIPEKDIPTIESKLPQSIPRPEIQKAETPKTATVETPTINIPIQPEQLPQGFSLTLNLTFNIGK